MVRCIVFLGCSLVRAALLPAVPDLVLSAVFINSLPAPLGVLNEDVK